MKSTLQGILVIFQNWPLFIHLTSNNEEYILFYGINHMCIRLSRSGVDFLLFSYKKYMKIKKLSFYFKNNRNISLYFQKYRKQERKKLF